MIDVESVLKILVATGSFLWGAMKSLLWLQSKIVKCRRPQRKRTKLKDKFELKLSFARTRREEVEP